MELFWIDIETTGLDPRKDSILEVAVFTASIEDPFNIHERLHAVLRPQEGRRSLIDMVPPVQDMHVRSGLVREVGCSGWIIQDFGAALVDIVPKADKYEDRPVLAGSSVHFDRDFLREQLPVMERFHHRLYDVSAVKLFCESLGMPKLPRAEAHRARDDVRESVAHAKACAKWVTLDAGWVCSCSEYSSKGRDKCRGCERPAPWLGGLP